VGEELQGDLGCISPVRVRIVRACVLWILASYYVMLCTTSQIASLCDRVSVLLPFRCVSVGCRFILLARCFVGTMSRTALYQAARTVSDTTPPQHSLVQNTVCVVCVCVCVVCVCVCVCVCARTYLWYVQRACFGIVCYLDPKRERTKDFTPLHSELV
jgi:hypothetical protein